MVLRDRNHPSIFCWSIGNEVIERKKLEVVTAARKLADYVHKFDPSRPVTSALAAWDNDWEIYDPLAAVHEIVAIIICCIERRLIISVYLPVSLCKPNLIHEMLLPIGRW